MVICFQFDFTFFIQFNLHLIGRKVNLQAVVFRRIKFDRKYFWTFSFDFFFQFGEFVQLDVACPMKPKQTTQICALSSTSSEARSINLDRQGHRSGCSARPDGPYVAQSRPPTAPQRYQGHRKPSFSSLFASQTTRAPTR